MKKSLILVITVGILILMYKNVSIGEDATFFFDNNGLTLNYRNIYIEENHEVAMDSNDYFHVKVKSKKGEVNISIKDSNGISIYDGTNVPTSEFDVHVLVTDIYVIEVSGENVSGEIKVRKNEDLL